MKLHLMALIPSSLPPIRQRSGFNDADVIGSSVWAWCCLVLVKVAPPGGVEVPGDSRRGGEAGPRVPARPWLCRCPAAAGLLALLNCTARKWNRSPRCVCGHGSGRITLDWK